MSVANKARNKLEQVKGKVKAAVGRATATPRWRLRAGLISGHLT
jgi:uncharacterized protein YjbJ (UPF0337 family)